MAYTDQIFKRLIQNEFLSDTTGRKKMKNSVTCQQRYRYTESKRLKKSQLSATLSDFLMMMHPKRCNGYYISLHLKSNCIEFYFSAMQIFYR